MYRVLQLLLYNLIINKNVHRIKYFMITYYKNTSLFFRRERLKIQDVARRLIIILFLVRKFLVTYYGALIGNLRGTHPSPSWQASLLRERGRRP